MLRAHSNVRQLRRAIRLPFNYRMIWCWRRRLRRWLQANPCSAWHVERPLLRDMSGTLRGHFWALFGFGWGELLLWRGWRPCQRSSWWFYMVVVQFRTISTIFVLFLFTDCNCWLLETPWRDYVESFQCLTGFGIYCDVWRRWLHRSIISLLCTFFELGSCYIFPACDNEMVHQTLGLADVSAMPRSQRLMRNHHRVKRVLDSGRGGCRISKLVVHMFLQSLDLLNESRLLARDDPPFHNSFWYLLNTRTLPGLARLGIALHVAWLFVFHWRRERYELGGLLLVPIVEICRRRHWIFHNEQDRGAV